MSKGQGGDLYKKFWEDQASFMDQSPWNLQKILKLTFLSHFNKNIEQLNFSSHSLSREGGKLIVRLKVPYNYMELDDFEIKAIELLGINKKWLIDMSLENSRCTHHSIN